MEEKTFTKEDARERLSRLVNNGYEPLPCIPHDAELTPSTSIKPMDRGKVPGHILLDGTWIGSKGWTAVEVTQDTIVRWVKDVAAGAGICIRTGTTVGIDIDVTDKELASKIEALFIKGLGVAPRRVGNSPKSLLVYRTGVPLKKSAMVFVHDGRGDEQRIEVLGSGQQFVAFGIHPKTRNPYEWHGGDPYQTKLADLSDITPDLIDACIEDVCELMAEQGYSAKSVKRSSGSSRRKLIGDPALTGVPEIAVRALAVLANDYDREEWVKKSAAFKAAVGGDESYYSAFERWCLQWREDRDGGVVTNRPEDARKIWDSIRDAEVGFEHLMRSAIHRLKTEEGDPTAFHDALAAWRRGRVSPTVEMEIIPNDRVDVTPDMPPDLLLSPGLVGAIGRYHDSVSHRVAPIYGIAAGLSAVSALAGGRYFLRMPTSDASTNLYIMCLGGSGSGKEGVRGVVKTVLKIAEMDTATSAASEAALLRHLHKRGDVLWMPDEFGRHLKFAGNPNGGHQYQFISCVMKTYGLFFSATERCVYADTKNNIDPVISPYLSVLATATPSSLTEALTNAAVVDGTLNRFIVINIGDSPIPFRDGPKGAMNNDLEVEIHGLSALTYLGSKRTGKIAIDPDDGAVGLLIGYRDEADEMRVAAERRRCPSEPLWARSYENALRVAAVVALGDSDPFAPRLTVDHARWAITYMRWSTGQSIRLLGAIGDTQTERDGKAIIRYVEDCIESPKNDLNRKGWVSKSQITRRFQQVKKHDRDNILHDLVEGGFLIRESGGGPTRPSELFKPGG